ncbi:hypothetical protein ADK38_41400, partial [Streptomyces varsoviensis]
MQRVPGGVAQHGENIGALGLQPVQRRRARGPGREGVGGAAQERVEVGDAQPVRTDGAVGERGQGEVVRHHPFREGPPRALGLLLCGALTGVQPYEVVLAEAALRGDVEQTGLDQVGQQGLGVRRIEA